jgi:hypothetical protein
MEQNSGESYYLNMKPKLMKDFDKMSKLSGKVLGQYFDQSKVNQTLEESRREYEAFIPQLPYIGGKKNSWTFNLVGGAQMLAIIRPLEREGLSVHEIGNIMYETLEAYFESRPRIVNWLTGKFMTSKFFRKKMKKKCADSQLRQYPGDWVAEFVEGEGDRFDFGLDMTECGICKFYKEQGAEEYVPYMCLGDYPQFRAFGIGLTRTQTIGNGAPKCDFRFKKGGKTPRGWPPEELEEFKGK